MVINDFKQICSLCRGAGRTAGINTMGISQINLAGTCPKCQGKGFQLTELGADLLKTLRPFIMEMIDQTVQVREAQNDAAESDDRDKE